MTSWVHHSMRSSGELAVELVEVTTLSALSGRKAMRSDIEPGSQASRTLRFDSNPMMVRKLIVIKSYAGRSSSVRGLNRGVGGNRQLQHHLKVSYPYLEVP